MSGEREREREWSETGREDVCINYTTYTNINYLSSPSLTGVMSLESV